MFFFRSLCVETGGEKKNASRKDRRWEFQRVIAGVPRRQSYGWRLNCKRRGNRSVHSNRYALERAHRHFSKRRGMTTAPAGGIGSASKDKSGALAPRRTWFATNPEEQRQRLHRRWLERRLFSVNCLLPVHKYQGAIRLIIGETKTQHIRTIWVLRTCTDMCIKIPKKGSA